jgi:hypothetical protein
MPNDKPPIDGDGIGSGEQRSGQPAVDEATGEVADTTSSPEVPPSPSNGEVRSDRTEEDKPEAESESAAEAAGPAEAESPPSLSSADYGEEILARERRRDAKANADTRPPDGETVTFRSVTFAEIYAGPAADSLETALTAIKWVNFDEPPLNRIVEARKGHLYSRGNFWLFSKESQGDARHFGLTSLPVGIDRIYGEYYVLGPSIVAIVLTFALTADDAIKIDTALRENVESRFDRVGANDSVKTVRDIKLERVRGIQDGVIRRCREWLRDKMPGTLSATTEGLGPPICLLVSVAVGKPFDTQAGYMGLLDLVRAYFVEKFVPYEFLFLVHPIAGAADGSTVAAFNEADAISHGWVHDLKDSPELFHQAISSLMIANGLNAALRSFEPRLRDIRADLNRLDIDNPAGTKVIELRNRLLGLSRELSTVCTNVAVLLDDVIMIWADFSPLVRVTLNGDTSAPSGTTADTKRQQLRLVIESLQAQEAGLRDLILVTSQSMSDTRNLELQTQVLGLTDSLKALTKWLIFLTIVLVVLGVVTLAVQVGNAPSGTVRVTPTSQTGSHTTSPPRPSLSPRSSASRTQGLGPTPAAGATSMGLGIRREEGSTGLHE